MNQNEDSGKESELAILSNFDEAKALISRADLVEAVDWINKAAALKIYATKARKGQEIQNQCAELKIRAERKAGEILSEMEKHPGAATQSSDATALFPPKLSDLGITKDQSYRWQLEASVPNEVFEGHIAKVKRGETKVLVPEVALDPITKEFTSRVVETTVQTSQPLELTTIGIIQLAKKLGRPKPPTTPIPLPIGKFDVIYADPPWKYDFSISETRDIEKQYPTMELEDIKTLSIPSADNAVLFLWATAPKLLEALEVMEAWGFEYKTCAIWNKEVKGMGYWFRIQHELLLLGVKGVYSPPPPDRRFDSIITSRRSGHSVKPDIVYDLIERMIPYGKYLELFAMRGRPNWESWGKEVSERWENGDNNRLDRENEN